MELGKRPTPPQRGLTLRYDVNTGMPIGTQTDMGGQDPRTLRNASGAIGGVTNIPSNIAPYGMGRGGYGRGGSHGGGLYGGMKPRIGSAGGAVGSGGIPTSQRGRAEAFGSQFANTPTWAMSQMVRGASQKGGLSQGLSQSGRYAGFGGLPPRPGTPSSVDPTLEPESGALNPFDYPSGMQPAPIRAFANGTRDSGPKPQLSIVGERGPELAVLPPHTGVIPNNMLPSVMQVPTAIDEVTGSKGEPYDGELRQDSQGNWWKYDAAQKRGIPLNPYVGNTNAPTPISSFDATPSQRYNDLAMRLSALRQEGFARGRARVAESNAMRNAELASAKKFQASGTPVAQSQGGGSVIRTPYGNAVLGGNRPKQFVVGQSSDGRPLIVDNLSGRGKQESTSDTFALQTGAEPSALEEITGVAETPNGVVEEQVVERMPPPDDRPPSMASVRNRLGFRNYVPPQSIDPSGAPSEMASRQRLGKVPTLINKVQEIKKSLSNENLKRMGQRKLMQLSDFLMSPSGEKEAESAFDYLLSQPK